MIDKLNLAEKFALVNSYWTPKIIAEANLQLIKIFKAKGEFVWHSHDKEDEFFFVFQGILHIRFREHEVVLHEGECLVIPKGVEHLPYAPNEAFVVLFEPKEVVNTGEAVSNLTVENPEWI